MLNLNPDIRPTAQECLSHSYFTDPPEPKVFTFSNEEWEKYMEYIYSFITFSINIYYIKNIYILHYKFNYIVKFIIFFMI